MLKNHVLEELTQIMQPHHALHVQQVTTAPRIQVKLFLVALAITHMLAQQLVPVVQMVTIVMSKA